MEGMSPLLCKYHEEPADENYDTYLWNYLFHANKSPDLEFIYLWRF